MFKFYSPHNNCTIPKNKLQSKWYHNYKSTHCSQATSQ